MLFGVKVSTITAYDTVLFKTQMSRSGFTSGVEK